MEAKRQLGAFLRTRRARIRPEDVGLAGYGGRRRVPGLRREELAQLAGVSASYYSRLEQGQSTHASPEVLDAIARALRLDETERRHLHGLTADRRARPAGRRLPPERLTPALRQLLAQLGDIPALVVGRRVDVLAWNPAGHALFASHVDPADPETPERRPNVARMVFLDAHTRALYADWPAKAHSSVAKLRLASGLYPDDAALAALIGELSVKSPAFAAMWADHRVKAPGTSVFELCHPLVGSLTVTCQFLGNDEGQHLVVATTEPGSPSHAALTLLGHVTATRRVGGPEERPDEHEVPRASP